MGRACLLAAMLTLPLAGCGGASDSSEADVRERIGEYLGALREGDGERACAQLTDLLQDVAAEFHATRLGTASCEDGYAEDLRRFSDLVDQPGAIDVQSADEYVIEVNGERATATFNEQRLELTKVGEDWLISGGLFGQ